MRDNERRLLMRASRALSLSQSSILCIDALQLLEIYLIRNNFHCRGGAASSVARARSATQFGEFINIYKENNVLYLAVGGATAAAAGPRLMRRKSVADKCASVQIDDIYIMISIVCNAPGISLRPTIARIHTQRRPEPSENV